VVIIFGAGLNKIIGLLVLFLAVAAGIWLVITYHTSTTGSSGASGGLSQAWLSQELMAWKPSQNSIYPMIFAPNFPGIGYDEAYESYRNPTAVAEAYQMINQTGSQAVTIFPGFAGWLLNDSYIVQTYNNATAMVAANHQMLFIQDSAAQYYGQHRQSWTQFTREWVVRDRVLAQTYHPAYFTVIVEPQWYWPFMVNVTNITENSNATFVAHFLNTTPLLNITDWVNLTNQLVSAVHNVSPDTKVGVSVPAELLSPTPMNANYTHNFGTKFLQNETKVKGVYFISFDIYGPNDFNSTLNFLNKYGVNGKKIWIAQTWANTGVNQNPCSAQDSEFLVLVYYFALKIHAEGISPFFTNCFVSYNSTPTQASALTNFYQGREPSFYEFQRIVASNKASLVLNYTP
jgi:hypothetical protein